MKKYRIGYTQGTFDLFHIGHLNLLKAAKQQCKYLIVGVNSDELVCEYKHKAPVIKQDNRQNIVQNLKMVDECIIVHTLDKVQSWQSLKYEAIFIGDDWLGNARWENTKYELGQLGVDVVFLPHTKGISSSFIKTQLAQCGGGGG